MNGLPYYKRYPRDFIEGTVSLPFELKGAYSIVLDLIYLHGGELVDDARYIAGQLGMSVRKWNKVREGLISARKLTAERGIISNFRADKELIISRSYQDKQRENATGPRKNKDLAEPRQSHYTDTDTDITPHTPLDGEFDRFWKVYPKRVEKAGARRKFDAAVKKGADPEQIISAAERYAQSDQVKRGYVKHPTTWLNNGCWDDEPERQEEDDYLAAQGIRPADDGGNFSFGGDRVSPPLRHAEDDVPRVFSPSAEENGPMPERDLQAGRGGLELLALRH